MDTDITNTDSKSEDIQACSILLSKTRIQYLRQASLGAGSQKPLIVLLHGFPENSWSWQAYINQLSETFTVIAPDLPGYNGSEGFSELHEYAVMNLVETMAEFIDAVSLRYQNKEASVAPVHLVAHDWGGVIAWPLCAFHSDKVRKLTILNAAHPSTFTREMAQNPRQQANSDYISDLISERAFEITSADDCKMLKRLYGGWFKKLSPRQQTNYLDQWHNRQSMENAFAYYKNMPQLVTTRIKANTDVQLPNINIHLPTQVLWGLKDTAFVPEVLDGMEDWVADLSLTTFDDADHWLHHQKVAEVLEKLVAFHT
ncbi:alpha/beta fold hydrolase [Ningiella sp. W23]|uniref:alpha/beta fold hydrolase n=1 Tax=Ningiella sp. W23 TaxID=3023715 RepID=UPI0037574355